MSEPPLAASTRTSQRAGDDVRPDRCHEAVKSTSERIHGKRMRLPELHWLPPGTTSDARRLLTARGLRAFGDGFVSVLLPVYLLGLGLDEFQIGAVATATLVGSAALTLVIGLVAHRFRVRPLLLSASVLMAATGVAF